MVIKGENCLATCPKCGNEVDMPVKTWPIPSNKALNEDEKPQLLGIFECPNCGSRFRHAVKNANEPKLTTGIKDVAEADKGTKGELMRIMASVRGKMNTMETERASLMTDIAKLKEVAQSRAEALEKELSTLRNDVRSLKDLVGYEEEKQ